MSLSMDLGITHVGMTEPMTRVNTISKEENAIGTGDDNPIQTNIRFLF